MTIIQGIVSVVILFVWAIVTTWVLTKLAQIRREMAEVEARMTETAAAQIKVAADQAILNLREAAVAAAGKLRSEAVTVATDLKSAPVKVRQPEPKPSSLSVATDQLQEAAEAVATELKGTAKKADAVATELKGKTEDD